MQCLGGAGVASGSDELPENTDSSQVIRAVSAPLYYAFVASGQPLTAQLAHQAADAALAAARAGVFTKTT